MVNLRFFASLSLALLILGVLAKGDINETEASDEKRFNINTFAVPTHKKTPSKASHEHHGMHPISFCQLMEEQLNVHFVGPKMQFSILEDGILGDTFVFDTLPLDTTSEALQGWKQSLPHRHVISVRDEIGREVASLEFINHFEMSGNCGTGYYLRDITITPIKIRNPYNHKISITAEVQHPTLSDNIVNVDIHLIVEVDEQRDVLKFHFSGDSRVSNLDHRIMV
ncbi:hypothetical protein PCE1_001012 [Barthelona sp. PCE]